MQETGLRSYLGYLLTEAERVPTGGRVAVYLTDRGEALVARLDDRVAAHHDAVESAYGRERTERLMRELSSLVARLAA
jgi:hypothetical protein